MRRITSSSGQHETVTLRRSESSDAPGICSLVNPSDRDVFGKINVMQLLEKAELAVTVADDQDQVLAHACFLDRPAAALVDPARWEHLVWEQLGAHACTPVNTLFMHLFVAREGFGPAAAEEIMRASFRAVSHLDYILLLTREAGDLGPALERVMEPLQPQTELRCRGWICCREELEPKLRVRQARVEDFDSILSRFEEKQRSSYVARPYLLSELIEGQNDDLHMAVCEVDGSVVGFMSVTSELELQQLAAIYHLEGQDQETSSPVDESVVGFMSVSSELDLQQLAAIYHLEGQDQETSSPPTAASPEQAGVFRIQLFGIDKEHETRSVDLISYMFQRFPELKFLFISVSPSSPEFPLLQNLVRVPTGPATPALCELYFLPSAWKGKILVRPAVPADLPAVSGLVKDLVSGGSLDSGESLLQDLDSFYKTGSDADAVRLGAFVAQVDGQIFGILIIRDEQDPEFLRSLYDLEWFLYWTHHGSEEHGLILHLVLVPWFQFLVRLLLKEALRLGGKSCLYLRGYQDEQHPQNSLVSPLDCVLSVSVPVRPRRQIIYPLEELGANAPPSRITEPQEPFSLSLVSRKLILEQKVTINSRIVVVGASDTGLSFLEELCSCPHIRFNNLTLISTHGFPGDQKPDDAGFLSTSHAYSSRDLNRFPAGSQFRVLTGKMVSINRKSRTILVSSGEEVPYHQLVLSTGLQYQVPGVLQPLPNDGPAPSNLLTLNDLQDCSSAGTWICSDFLGGEGTALLYGSSLDVFTSTEALLVLGVPGSRVQLVLPPPEPGPPCFPDPAVEAAVTASLETSGVQVHRGWTLVRMDRDGPDGPLKAVTFSRDPPEPEPPQDPEPFKVPEPPRDPETLHLQCGVFLNFSSKSVDPDVSSSISRSFLVFDGRLVINAGFQTCDPNIYAAGPLTQFSRRYHSPEWSHASFSSKEVGRELALVLLRRLDPTLEPDRPPPGSDPLVPLYQKPKVQGGKLPGGFHYLHVTKPSPSCSKKTPAQTVQNPVVSTGRAETGNYFCLHLDPQDQLESLVCLSLEPLPWSNYLVLVGKHQQLLGRLLDQYQQGQIQDLYRFFREPWVLPIFLDRFPDFQQELQQELQLISSDTLKDPGETEKTDVPPGGSAAAAAALRNRTLNYLSFNQNLLPMFPRRGQM